jgi:hypothetical protein
VQRVVSGEVLKSEMHLNFKGRVINTTVLHLINQPRDVNKLWEFPYQYLSYGRFINTPSFTIMRSHIQFQQSGPLCVLLALPKSLPDPLINHFGGGGFLLNLAWR